jgi:hypothetical protein
VRWRGGTGVSCEESCMVFRVTLVMYYDGTYVREP